MLEALRRGASTWIAKILIGLLVISFAVWGVSDIFSGPGQAELILVGEEAVSQEEYQRAVQLEQRQMSAERNRQLSLSDARAQGLDNRVMTRLVGGAALDAHAKDLQLGITNEAVAQEIMQAPAFHDETGKFDAQRFQQILNASDLNEQAFVRSQKQASIREQLTNTVGASVPPPQVLLDAVNRFSREMRVLRYVEVPASAAGEIPAPIEEDLKKYYEANKPRFTAPEYRQVGAIVATPETVPGIEISEADLRAAYDQRKDQLGKPERRQVQQISFPTMEEAKSAYDRIKGGADFMAVAKERGLSEADANLGMLQKSQLADQTVADAAFKLEKDQLSEPVDGAISKSLVRVTAIEPGETPSFEDAKKKLEEDLRKERAADKLADLYGKVEDERAAGAKLEEAAQKLGLKYVTIDGVDQQGNGRDGKPVDLPQRDLMVREIFASDPGVEANAIEVEGGGYVWFDVLGSAPEEVKPFDQVRADVEKAWRDNEQRTRLSRFSRELVEKLQKGETLENIAKAWNGEIKTTPPLTRAGGGGLPADISAVSQAFALPPQAYGSAPGADQNTRMVFQVMEVRPPAPPSGEEAKKLQDQVSPLLADDLVMQYVKGLQNRYGVNVNRQALDRLTGSEQ